MSSDKLIGRIEVYEKIKNRLENCNDKVSITSIGGSGGIGKTYLLNRLLEDTFFDDDSNLVLFPEVNKNASFEKYTTEGFLKSANSVLPITKGYFNETSRLSKEWAEIETKRKKELLRLAKQNTVLNGIDDDTIDSICSAIASIGNLIFTENAKYKKLFGKQGLTTKQSDEFARLAKIILKKKIHNPLEGRLPDLAGKRTLRFNLINNFNETASKAMLNDISYILLDAQNFKEKLKFKTIRGNEAKKLKKLVIIIDDYEFFQEKLNDYFLNYFIPEIRKKSFRTQIILVGRDLILDTSAEWDRYVKNIEQFEITTFDRESCIEYLNSVNIFDNTTIDRLINDTEGYPYMLYLEALSYKEGGEIGAHKKKMFYDRITRWMDENEKDWFESLCFLNVINVDTVRKMLPDNDADYVFQWFTNQASIRDSKSTQYRVKPFLRSKTIDYLQSKSPEYYNELYNNASTINCAN